MFFSENLEDIIFDRHEHFPADELVVLSGYLGPTMVEKLASLGIESTVIYGMYSESGIQEKLYKVLRKIDEECQSVEVLFSKQPVHSKCYIWRKNGEVLTALIGSANFSSNGLQTDHREVLAEVSRDTFKPLNSYVNGIIETAYTCDYIEQEKAKISNDTNVDDSHYVSHGKVLRATLLARGGEVATASGLNWGFSRGHTCQGDAYISIKKSYINDFPTLFPKKRGRDFAREQSGEVYEGKITRENDTVDFIWDDGLVMTGLLEGSQIVDGVSYPKQISSSPRKNIMGQYLRKRLGISDKVVVTKKILEEYGRTHIDISLLENGIYYLDFSVPPKTLVQDFAASV